MASNTHRLRIARKDPERLKQEPNKSSKNFILNPDPLGEKEECEMVVEGKGACVCGTSMFYSPLAVYAPPSCPACERFSPPTPLCQDGLKPSKM